MIKPRSLTSLSLFFPCYNEEANVGSMIEQGVKVGEDYGLDYEVIIVDDGSKDNSANIVREWAKKNPRVRLVQHGQNQGYGAALRTGFRSATKDYVFFADGDNQYRVSEIEKLFSILDGNDVVIGYRINRQDKPHRRINGYLWTQLNKVLLGIPARDVDCGFKIFRRKHLENLEMKSNYLLIHAEIISRLKKKGCKIKEIGISHFPRTAGKASATAPSAIFKTFKELFKLYWQLK